MSSLYIRRVLLKPAEGVSLPSVLMGSVSPKSKHHRIEDYEGKLVLVEAKKYDGELVRDKFGKKIYQRIEDIANMLHDPFPYDELPVLQCEGYSEDSGTNEYLLIFSLPPEASTEPLIPISLLDYFQQRAVWSLTARIRLARRLANAIYAIHKKGWLHKGIRGDNVLFFPGAPGAPRSIEKPRLAGFDFARRDGPWEEEPTEKMV
jgi:hypothetical protein